LRGILTPQQIRNLRQSINAIETFTPAEIAAVAQSFARAFRTQLQVCAGVAGVSLLFAGLAWQRDPPTFVSMGKAQGKKTKEKGGKEGVEKKGYLEK
jgi:hypothetical protein